MNEARQKQRERKKNGRTTRQLTEMPENEMKRTEHMREF